MEKEVSEDGIGLEGDNEFHNALAIAVENTAMVKILNMCEGLLNLTREATLNLKGQPQKSHIDHRAIFEAVRDGDERKAKSLMNEHLTKALKILKKKP